MLPRMPRAPWIAPLFLLVVSAPRAHAEPPAASALVRYHFGDDAKWADPAFDDSAWPVATGQLIPTPPPTSDGMVWLRYHVAVPPDRSLLAVRLDRDKGACSPGEFWVNGVHVGSQGRFPPEPFAAERCVKGVFEIPGGVVTPGGTAVVSWRGWISPIWRSRIDFTPPVLFPVSIGSRGLALSQESDARAHAQLGFQIDAFLWILEALIALVPLVIWRRARAGASLFWFPVFALSWCGMGSWNTIRPDGLSYIVFWLVSSAFWVVVNISLFEFIKAALHSPRWAVRVLEGIGILWPVMLFLPALALAPIPALGFILVALPLLVGITFLGQIALAAWAWWRGPRETRGLAITLFCAGVAYLLVDNLDLLTRVRIGSYEAQTDNLATALVIAAMCYQLLGRLWADWRRKEELDAEFDAAREVQQQLVAPAVDLPGFKIESVYAPAKQVGGDFFRVLLEADGSVLVVVGDVSGKGLKAAMTVSAIVGALRTMPQGVGENGVGRTGSPAQILTALNRGLVGQMQGGFVTCCAARVGRDGTVTIANAGHLAPYRSGAEAEVAAGLPLGLDPYAAYEERQFRLESAESLTFVSDGVVEARNAAGELFGFERTLAMSGSGAQALAQAAVDFGQDDDITVLTLTRLVDGRRDAAPQPANALVPAVEA